MSLLSNPLPFRFRIVKEGGDFLSIAAAKEDNACFPASLVPDIFSINKCVKADALSEISERVEGSISATDPCQPLNSNKVSYPSVILSAIDRSIAFAVCLSPERL